MRLNRVTLYFVLVFIFIAFNFYLRPIKGNKLITSQYRESEAYLNGLYKSDEYFKSKVLKKSDYYVYRKIIDACFNNESKVTIKCNDDCSSFKNAYNAIYLDHPELLSFLGIRAYKINNNRVTYDNLDNLGKIRTTLGSMRIEREMENIREDTKKMNDKEKILYVYNYVASHNYDTVFTYLGSNQSAYSFFTKKSSVCAGFAKASQIIFQNIGISSYLVMSSDHMWNYVKYDGKYYIFDATVGASYSDKNNHGYYDGLGVTTTGDVYGMYKELYPKIEEKSLRDIFNV